MDTSPIQLELPLDTPEVTAPSTRDKQVGGTHYKRAPSNMQPWDIALAWKLNGWEMNVLKYLLRHQYKNKLEDIEKAIHYLEFIRDNYQELYDTE